MKISDKFSSDPEPTPPVVIAPPAPRTFGRELRRVSYSFLQALALGVALLLFPVVGVAAFFWALAGTDWQIVIQKKNGALVKVPLFKNIIGRN